MSNHAKAGTDAVRVQDRHGRKGHVALTTTVPPDLKDHLVELAQFRGTTLKAEVEAALRAHLYRVRW
jgi:hypothetical protein